jgi:hypothetical protein
MHRDRSHLHNVHFLDQMLCVFFVIVSVDEQTD